MIWSLTIETVVFNIYSLRGRNFMGFTIDINSIWEFCEKTSLFTESVKSIV